MPARIQGSWSILFLRLFKAWTTVEWSLLPNLNPINAEGIDVCLRQRYIAICLGRVILFNLLFDFKSPRLILKCLQINLWISSTVISFSICQPASVRGKPQNYKGNPWSVTLVRPLPCYTQVCVKTPTYVFEFSKKRSQRGLFQQPASVVSRKYYENVGCLKSLTIKQ